MNPSPLKRLCLTPRAAHVGGVRSFQARLSAELARRGIEVTYDLADRPYDAVLVSGGTRDLRGLRRARQASVPVVQRLDGINWLHRVRRWSWPQANSRVRLCRTPTGPRHWLRAERGNWLLAHIRRRLATGIVYQSVFARGWWERAHGPTPVPHAIIHNGISLDEYTPDGPHDRPTARARILLVEGSLAGGYEQGLETAVALAERLQDHHGVRLELVIAGAAAPELQAHWNARARVPLVWAGLLPAADIPRLDRSAHLLYSADLNPACPNSVIEALACGLPVAAYDTGALKELVTGDSGRVTPYGGDPWKLDPPDVATLAAAAAEILADNDRFRRAARARAEAAFALKTMVDKYIEFLNHR
ncbi:MAG: glycosyltransferase family 4 protein [Chloroflexi bacterium]|nr:glycosyltransferase family 4 protein [Chloroflexota bacterium]MBI3159666.1 glycosyltransferase family 4 protein [Chloroflexota bacterium]